MLTAAIFGAGGSALAAEKDEETGFKNHGAEVSSFATSIPGSPEKGKIMRSIANKNLQEMAPDEDDDPDNPMDEDEATDVPVDEDEATDVPVVEDETTDVPVIEEEPADEDESANETDETEKPADDNINEDTTSPDQSTDSTIITEEQVNEYRSVIQNYGSLIDYYDFLIQEHLGMVLPDEDGNVAEETAEDLAEVPVVGDTVEESAEDVAETPVEGDIAAEETAEDVAETPVEGDIAAEETAKETVQTTIWDNLVGYYQQVVTAYNSLFSSLKK